MQRGFRRRVLMAYLVLLSASLVDRTAEAGLFRNLRRSPPICCQYFYVEPQGVPQGAKVPVVLYLHGAGGATLGPPRRDAWAFQRLAERGYLVLVPLFQEGNVIRPYTWMTSAICGYKSALASVRSRGRVVPDTQRLAIVSESMGSLFALRMAALAAHRDDLPAPQAIIMHDGAGYSFAPYYSSRIRDIRRWCYTTAPFDSFPSVADNTLLVSLIAETSWQHDAIEEPADGDAVGFGNGNVGGVVSRSWHTTGIKPENRFAFLVHGDDSRSPPLISDHGVGVDSPDDVEAIYWRVTEAALEAVFAGNQPDFSEDLSRTWSDGSPQLTVVPDVPKPQPFVWDCGMYLRLHHKAHWGMPRGVCRGCR
jgi:hypothetical protein